MGQSPTGVATARTGTCAPARPRPGAGQCQKRETFVLRLFNPGLEEVETKVNFHLPVKAAWLTNMNEEQKEKLDTLDKNSITLNFSKKKIITCEVELAK